MKNTITLSALALGAALLAACGGDGNDDAPADARFEVRVTNLTNAQPLSPLAVMMHRSGFNSFIDGITASTPLETLAEGGSNADVLSEVQASAQHIASGSTPTAVGPREISPVVTLTVPAANLSDLRLTVIGMLVRTNDAFTGANAADISDMAVGSSVSITGPTWDAGTENNTETAATIPGLGGEGFNAARDDIIDRVRFHQGVVTNASVESGLATSSLTEADRFLNLSSRIVVTRVE